MWPRKGHLFLLIWYQFWSLQKLLRNVEEVMTAAFQLAAPPKTALFEVCIGGRPCHLCHRIWPFGLTSSASIVPRSLCHFESRVQTGLPSSAQTVGDFSIFTYLPDGQLCIEFSIVGPLFSHTWSKTPWYSCPEIYILFLCAGLP